MPVGQPNQYVVLPQHTTFEKLCADSSASSPNIPANNFPWSTPRARTIPPSTNRFDCSAFHGSSDQLLKSKVWREPSSTKFKISAMRRSLCWFLSLSIVVNPQSLARVLENANFAQQPRTYLAD